MEKHLYSFWSVAENNSFMLFIVCLGLEGGLTPFSTPPLAALKRFVFRFTN